MWEWARWAHGMYCANLSSGGERPLKEVTQEQTTGKGKVLQADGKAQVMV